MRGGAGMTEKIRLPASEIMRGTSHRVIVVQSPDTRIFKEAVFILRDDYFDSHRSEKELMREAAACAGAFTASAVPKRRKVPYWLIFAGIIAVLLTLFFIFI